MKTIEASRAIVLGRGIQEVEPGLWKPTPASRARAEVMVRHYHDNVGLFRRMGAKIVCSGSHAGAALKQEKPPGDISEGKGIADILVRDGVPHELIEVEGKSISTFSNYEETVRAKAFPSEYPFTLEDPLLVVASFPHGTYRGVPIARAAFGIKERKAVRLLHAEKEPLRTHAIEAVGGLATKLAIMEIGVQPYSEEDLERAGKRFAEFTENPRLLVPAAARRLVA